MEEKEFNNFNSSPIEENESNAAKRIRLLGIENDDKIHDESVAIKSGSFFGNLWYQHKWGIIIGSILIITAIIFIVSMINKPKYDIYLSYAGPLYMDYETKAAVEYAFLQISEDYDGDGEKKLNFASITYQNPEQQEKNPEEIKQSYGQILQTNENYKALNTIHTQMMSGTVAVYLIDEKLYKEYEAKMIPLEELAGVQLDDSLKAGKSGVYFKKTDFYKHMYAATEGRALKNLPDDTVLCILPKLQTMDGEMYESSQELVKNILKFKK